MGNLTIFALLLAGLICVQATQTRRSAYRADTRRRSDRPQGDPRCTQNGIVPIPGDCQHYLLCRDGGSRVRRCPEGFFFDSISYCTPSDSADCGIPILQQGQAICDGPYSSYSDCASMCPPTCTSTDVVCPTVCVEGCSCDPGYILQDDGGMCIPEDQCPSLSEEDEVEEFQCTENGRFANPNSCGSYIECSIQSDMAITTVVRCPAEQHYNIETKQCDDKCSAQCDQDLACFCQWPHCLITCEEPNGVFPVPSNCRLYLQCTDNIPRIMRCRDREAFDPERSECVNIDETNCCTASNDVLSIMQL